MISTADEDKYTQLSLWRYFNRTVRNYRAQADLKSGIISDYKSLYYKAVGFQIRLSGSKVLRLGYAIKNASTFSCVSQNLIVPLTYGLRYSVLDVQ